MLYKDIFDPIVYNVFGLSKNRIGQLDCPNNRVDIKLIANTLGLKIEDSLIDIRASINNANQHENTILVDLNGKQEQINQTIAFQIGNYLLDQNDPYNRARLEFVYQILAPKKLILYWMKKYTKEKGINIKNANVDDLLWYLSKNLQVPYMLIKWRMINLNYII